MKQQAHLRAAADFGLVVHQARVSRGLSQMELAEIVGIPQSTVSQIESGQSTIYVRRLLAIAQATGLEFSASWSDD